MIYKSYIVTGVWCVNVQYRIN